MALESYHFAEKAGEAHAPLVFTFHGTGGDEYQFLDLAEDLFPGSSIISPRGDVSEYGAARFFRRTGEGIYDMADLAARTASMAAFIAAHKTRTGAQRVIGLGYSNGANILASVMFSHPDLFTDAVLMHPLIPFTPKDNAALAGKRVLITAGRMDPICPAPLTEKLAGYFRAQNADVSVHWHPGGHDIRESELHAIEEWKALPD